MIDLIAIAILFIVIILLLADRYFAAEQTKKREDRLLEENSRLVKAVISKNANDYVMTTSIDKVAPEEKPPTDPDLVPEEAISDEAFFDAIGKGLKS